MELTKDIPNIIYLPEGCRSILLEHCRRKLDEKYLPDEPREKKAFGIIAGKKTAKGIIVRRCFPLQRNVRLQKPYKDYIDKVMEKYAIPSETPLSKRGWVADPGELQDVLVECQRDNITVVGSYHMHRLAWQHDRDRDTPTKLDDVLGEQSRMIMFIISMVIPDRPVIRAFYEGKLHSEFSIVCDDLTPAALKDINEKPFTTRRGIYP